MRIAFGITLNSIVLSLAMAAGGGIGLAHAQQQQHMTKTTTVVGQQVTVQRQSAAPELTAEQLKTIQAQSERRSFLTTPPVPVLPTAPLKDTPPIQPQTVPEKAAADPSQSRSEAQTEPQAPGTYTVFRATVQNPYSSGTSQVAEPHAASNGPVALYSANWFASMSTDGGQTFSFINPYTQFPSIDGGFCCDQTVIYDKKYDLFAWSLQYINTATKNTIRVAVATGGTLLSSGAAGFCYYDFNAQTFGLASGLWLDYPHMVVSDNYIWYATNVFNASDIYQTSIIWRMPLSTLAGACGGSVSASYWTDSGGTITTVEGATTSMYFAQHASTSSLRVHKWDESSTTITTVTTSHTAYPAGGRGSYSCAGPDGLNWCGRTDARIMTGWVAKGIVGFMWNAPQGTSGFGVMAYPYVHVVRLVESTRALSSDSPIYSANYAFIYPSIGVNDRGDLGGTLYYGGGAYYPTIATFIWDDIGSQYYTVAASDAGTVDRWGDYTSSRRHGYSGNTWVTAAHQLTSGTVKTWYVWMGRQRDNPRACLGFGPMANFNADGRADILWRNNTGSVGIWFLNGAAITGAPVVANVDLSWNLIGAADFNGDSRGDFLWRSNAGAVGSWFMNGSSVIAAPTFGTVNFDWNVVGTGDFNGDGRADLLWRSTSGAYGIWFLNGASIIAAPTLGTVDLVWRIEGVADFNGDAMADILWRNTSTGAVGVWLMNGGAVIAAPVLATIPSDWHLAATGDLNGDLRNDLIWRNDSGAVGIWFLNGASVSSTAVIATIPTNWHIDGAGDVNGDGKGDLLWRHDNGSVGVWLMNGASVISTPSLAGSPTSWHIVGGDHDLKPNVLGRCGGT